MIGLVLILVGVALVGVGLWGGPREWRRRRHARTLTNIERLERELGIAGVDSSHPIRSVSSVADRWREGVSGAARKYESGRP